jgi:hypothetical protein
MRVVPGGSSHHCCESRAEKGRDGTKTGKILLDSTEIELSYNYSHSTVKGSHQ